MARLHNLEIQDVNILQWWRKPRKVSVVVDNDSWILPFAQEFVDRASATGDEAKLVRTHEKILPGGIAFFLGCMKIAKPATLARNHRNLVVHESDLPRGRGFAPVAWQILEGVQQIPVCLLDAANDADSGPVIYRDYIELHGHELLAEWRTLQGQKTTDLCWRFLNEELPPNGVAQEGEHSYYSRRRPDDSQLDPNKTIADQFDLLRIVDNDRYPAFFEHRGMRYRLLVEMENN